MAWEDGEYAGFEDSNGYQGFDPAPVYQENDGGWNGMNAGAPSYMENDGGWSGVNTMPTQDYGNFGGLMPQANNWGVDSGDNVIAGMTGSPGNMNPGNITGGGLPDLGSNNMGGYLQQLFGGSRGGSSGGGILGGIAGKGLAALLEGYQNKKKASAMQSIASNPALDPFGSQRGFYQQQAQQAVQDPYSAPIVKSQVENLNRVQAIKDAAAGRRSNVVGSSPGVIAEQAKIAQNYLQSMLQAGGSQIQPNGGAMVQAQMAGANADVNGYLSPLANVLGNTTQTNSNQATLDAIMKMVNGNK